jgi:hypothetical protein
MVSIWLTKIKGCGETSTSIKSALREQADFRRMPAVLKAVLLAILLDARRAQSRQAMLIDRKLPGKEFVDGQSVAAAGLFEGKQAPADCGNDFGFTANNPPFGAGRGQIGNS